MVYVLLKIALSSRYENGTKQRNIQLTLRMGIYHIYMSQKIFMLRVINKLKEQYPVTAHVPNLDFSTECREFKREESENLEKSVCIVLCRVRYYTKLLRITNQWYSVPVKYQFGQNRDFLAFLSLPLAGGLREGKRFNSSWRLISPFSFHTSSDNRERNTQKWNSNHKDYLRKKRLRRGCDWGDLAE